MLDNFYGHKIEFPLKEVLQIKGKVFRPINHTLKGLILYDMEIPIIVYTHILFITLYSIMSGRITFTMHICK